jgi:hypothetical protein
VAAMTGGSSPPPQQQQLLLPRVHVAFFGAMAAAIIVLLLANFEDLLVLLQSSFWTTSSKPAAVASLTVGKRPISIGEDCDDDATKCQYFYPGLFLRQWRNDAIVRHKRNGGKRFATAPLDRCYKNMISLYKLQCREEFVRGGRCRARAYRSSLNDTTHLLDLPLQFGYKKVYKTGGTAIDEVLRRIKYKGKSMMMETFRPIKPEHNMSGAHDFMRWVSQAQSRENGDYPIIAIVRDVIPRFISAANQLIGMKGRLRTCSDTTEDTRSLMKCAVTALIDGHRDPHFESLVADLNCNVGGHNDVRFSLYSMDDVPEVLKALGSKNETKKINSSDEKNIILTIADMNFELIEKVCRWYSADVAMLRSSGFDVSYCA